MKYIAKAVKLAAASALAVACGGVDAASESDTANQDEAALTRELEGKFNAYAQALADRDTELLATLMSTEIHERADASGMDMGAFADKMRGSMLTNFDTMSANTYLGVPFSIESVRLEGDAARVEVSFQGRKLEKPFYFVNEGGSYKLNLARPGFSKPAPEGSGASLDSYLVKNENPWTTPVICSSGNGFLNPGAQGYFSCDTKCGFWSGTRFYSPSGSGAAIKCDWNSWGVDAYYNDFYAIGVRCADGC